MEQYKKRLDKRLLSAMTDDCSKRINAYNCEIRNLDKVGKNQIM